MAPPITHIETHVRRRSGKTEETRNRILEESIKLFIEQGYEKTTTRQILQKVGILNGSLYNIYKSKEDIFSDIILMSIAEVMNQAPRHIPDGKDKIDSLTYLLCIEMYISNRSQRISELLCIANENWNIRRRVDEMVVKWVNAVNAFGSTPTSVDYPFLRMNACIGAAFVMIERMANEPGSIDEKAAMIIITEAVNALFRKESDAKTTVESLLDSFSREEIVVCGQRIL